MEEVVKMQEVVKMKEIEKKIDEKFRRSPAKRKVAYELLELAKKGVKSPRGGLWTLWIETKHLGRNRRCNAYVGYWYKHARSVLAEIPELADLLSVK